MPAPPKPATKDTTDEDKQKKFQAEEEEEKKKREEEEKKKKKKKIKYQTPVEPLIKILKNRHKQAREHMKIKKKSL